MSNSRKLLAYIIIIFIVGVNIPVMGDIGATNYRDDTTPPVTTCTLDPAEPDGLNDWYVSDVEVTLVAFDNMSGVNATYYRINEGKWNTYTNRFFVEEDGNYLVEYYSVDNAGNIEDVKSADFKIDRHGPFIHPDIEEVEENKLRFTAICVDVMSGMDRVEYYYKDELMFTSYEEPYEWIWTGPFEINVFKIIAVDKAGVNGYPGNDITPTKVIGIILNPEFSQYNVTFFAIIAFIWNSGEVVKFEKLTFCTIGSSGYIGRFFIRALFRYDPLPY